MIKIRFLFLLLAFYSFELKAQFPVPGKGGQGMMNVGRVYGKIIDSKTKKAIDAVSVQLIQNKYDSATKTKKDIVVTGQLTRSNGEFDLEGLAVMATYKIKISAIGYKTIEQKIAFDIKFNQGGDMMQMLNKVNKDLGDIALESEIKEVKEVVITGEKPQLQLGIDRKIFNVDKNIISAGGNAVDVMRNVPTVSVDVEGNVSLRNNTPEIFVDGRPTLLSLDQIPADAIQSIELITNPSAKYDASGGQSAIINIVLKKNRQIGYNGNLRAGIDMRARVQSGADFNIRQGKLNVFASAMLNQRKSIAWGETDRNNQNPPTNPSTLFLENDNTSTGRFGFLRGGVDYFINNRNTLSITGNFSEGNFKTDDISDIAINFLNTDILDSTEKRNTYGTNIFRNRGGQLSYKRVFTKPGKEWQADLNYSKVSSDNDQTIDISNVKFSSSSPDIRRIFNQRVDAGGSNQLLVGQTDFINPLNDNSKIEMGLRTQIRWFESFQNNFINNIALPGISNAFSYEERVHAVYLNYSQKLTAQNLNFQTGLRAESSEYVGQIVGKATRFSNRFPLALFPSAFISKSLSGKQDLQLNYTRRVKRPNFFQLLPNTDYTDVLNYQTGNPDLLPEFTNSVELGYQKTYGKKNNTVLVSLFGKQTENLIARYQSPQKIGNSDTVGLVTTWVNATTAYAAGLELVFKNNFNKWWEANYNFNYYYSKINGTKDLPALENERTSFTIKMNNTFKLGKGWTVQLSADYNSRSIIPVSSGNSGGGGFGGGGGGRGGGMMGGGGFGGGQISTTQGYIDENYYADLGLRKELKIKNNTATFSINWSDFLRTRQNIVFSQGVGFDQNSWRRRDPQFVRVNISYRFGKMDVSVFKRKNNRIEMDDIPMQP
ncbi:MAG: TonB-dependent receptor [Bacteroidetes bacterium]|nr:TonB-dependent receptor [Bacteroidota bacterium]